ncbi:MAG: iron-sulfur protein [Anaerolineaceae bacterium]|nr:iron-sulfur protein [Anaerolineaceae bacterium]
MATIPQIFRSKVDRLLERTPEFQETSKDIAHQIHQMVLDGGEQARQVADVLHGKQVGHPLHPILTDITIGSWALGTLFDFLALITFSSTMRKAANRLVMIGTATAIPTALAGITDYSTIKQNAAQYGAAHGLLNSAAFYLYFRSLGARARHSYLKAFLYSFFGLGFAVLASWLGGDLVYRHRIGVNHAPPGEVDGWTPVMAADDLAEGEPTRVDVDEDTPVLLYRNGDAIHAIGAVCSHAGGPLEEGSFDGVCVQCPWHDSVFDLRDGQVVHGPATFEQPAYQTRVENGQIEIRQQLPEIDPIIVQVETPMGPVNGRVDLNEVESETIVDTE